MPFIELGLGDIKEARSVPADTYALQIENIFEKRNEEKNRDSIMVVINVMNPPAGIENPAPIFHYLSFPNSDDDKRNIDFFMLNLKRFLTVFNIPFEANGFDTEDLPGATGECYVEEEEFEGSLKNVLRLPPLED